MSARTPSSAALGFENAPEITAPVSLAVKGTFPSWLSGALYRVGPGTFRPGKDGADKAFDVQHWFDGLAMVHRFDIRGGPSPGVHYMCRRTSAAREARVAAQGGWGAIGTFGQRGDPCESYFAKFATFLRALPAPDRLPRGTAPDAENVVVTLSPGLPGLGALAGSHSSGKTQARAGRPAYVVAQSDSNRLQVLDAETLDPLALETYEYLDPALEGPMTAAHPCTDMETGDVYNFVLRLGPMHSYTVFRLSEESGDGMGKTTVLARITDAPAAYLHSFFMTKRYVVLCIWQADFTMMGVSAVWHRNIAQAIGPWNPARPALFYVIDRAGGGVVAKYKAPPFFAFHAINGYEDSDDLILDLIIYPDASVISNLYLDSLRAPPDLKPAPEMIIGRARRYVLRSVATGAAGTGATRDADEAFTLPQRECIELPATDPRRAGAPYRFVYGISRAHPGSDYGDQLIKLDMVAAAASPPGGGASGAPKVWFEDGCTPGEPVFVPDPEGVEEDDGVLLSVMLDGQMGRSMLVCLDARTMCEVGRAEMETVFPMGFHGMFVS